jgi:hypothetical protein
MALGSTQHLTRSAIEIFCGVKASGVSNIAPFMCRFSRACWSPKDLDRPGYEFLIQINISQKEHLNYITVAHYTECVLHSYK